MTKLNTRNDGTRTLFESVLAPEVISALTDWVSNAGPPGVLLGGLALSFYVRPRYTTDVDVLYMTASDIPAEVAGFKRHRPSAFQHNKTHVEIEVLTPEFIKMPPAIAQKIIQTSVESNGVRVASPTGLAVSKLFRFNARDRADIIDLLKGNHDIDITGFGLPQQQIANFIAASSEAETDPD